MRFAFRAAALAGLVLAAACKSDGATLQDKLDGLLGDIDGLFGKSSLPGRHLAAIRDVHEKASWSFRADAEEPLERTRTAVRALASCDYVSWGEAALVVEIVSSMADEHTSSLVRAEALDTLTSMATWTLAAAAAPEHPATEPEMIEGVKVLKLAVGRDDGDPAFTFQVASAVGLLASYPFDRVELPDSPGSDNRSAARACGTQLRTARGALRSINGRTLEGFQRDPSVREALDRAYVSLSAAVIRLTLMKSALGDAADTTRGAALRDIGALAPAGGAAVLRRVLLHDGSASVRREAAKALAAYAVPLAVPALIDGLADEMAEVRGASARSLETISGESFGDDRAAWIRWWQSTGSRPAASGTGE